MMGLPPTLGFVAKELSFAGPIEFVNVAVPFFANLMIAAVAVAFIYEIFLRSPRQDASSLKDVSEPSWFMKLPPFLLAFLCLAGGIFISQLSGFFNQTAAILAPDSAALQLSAIPHAGPGLTLSAGLWILAFVVVWRLRPYASALGSLVRWSGSTVFQKMLSTVLNFANWQTQSLQSGRVLQYMAVILLAAFILLSLAISQIWPNFDPQGLYQLSPVSFVLCLPFLLIFALTGLLVRTTTKMTAVLSLGGVGFTVALLFAVGGAPDLALTQFAVEALMLLLLVILSRGLPSLKRECSKKAWRLFASIGFGSLMALIAYMALEEQMPSRLTALFVAESWLSAHGRNVVNTILVDFRGIDTLGEIVVLVISALGVSGLFVGRQLTQKTADKTS